MSQTEFFLFSVPLLFLKKALFKSASHSMLRGTGNPVEVDFVGGEPLPEFVKVTPHLEVLSRSHCKGAQVKKNRVREMSQERRFLLDWYMK